MIRWLWMLCALTLAESAEAEFTPEEKAQVQTQVDALNFYDRSLHWTIGYCNSVPADATKCANFIDAAAEGRYGHFLGLLWLLDMNGDADKTAGRNILATETRAQIVARGVAAIQADSWYTGAENHLNGITGATIATAKQLFASGQVARHSFNASLPYTEPRLNANMEIPGSTREKSDTAGPHGDYRRAGELFSAWADGTKRSWWNLSADLRSGASIATAAFQSGHTSNGAVLSPQILALLAGVESPALKPHIDTMFAGGTTARGREFFQVLLLQESLINWTHTDYPHYLDINGRLMLRGYTYDLEAACQAAANTIRAEPAISDHVRAQVDYMRTLCLEWGRIDDIVYQGTLALKNFQVFPAPGPNTCDPASTTWDPDRHLCVGTVGATCPVGESCLPPPPPCPDVCPGGQTCQPPDVECPPPLCGLTLGVSTLVCEPKP